MRRYLKRLVALLAILAWHADVAHASVWVSNHGADSGNCGLPTSPCRSISQAIENAVPGDTIWVGSGHYGNVSGQIGFGGPGDEHPQAMPNPWDTRWPGCIVCLTKAVKVYSLDGAATTVIDSGPSPATFVVTVALLADGAQFGAAGHGFTVTGGNAVGVALSMANWDGSKQGVTIYGNVDINDATGFALFGPDGYSPGPSSCPPIPQACPGYGGTVLLQGNQASGNAAYGFWVEPRNVSPPKSGAPEIRFIVNDNVARDAGTGFDVEPGIVECDDCFDYGRADVVLTQHNVATGGSFGFSMRRAGLMRDNVASDNSVTGFMLVDSGPFYRNSAMGNAGPGVIVGLEAATEANPTPPRFITPFTQNNFFGNDRNRPALALGNYGSSYDFDPGPSAHCGVLNMGPIWQVYTGVGHFPPSPPIPSVTLPAANNYWGSANGPTSTGPGDAAAGACAQNSSITETVPSLTAEVPISPLP